MTRGFRQVRAGNALRPVRWWFSVRVARAQVLKWEGSYKLSSGSVNYASLVYLRGGFPLLYLKVAHPLHISIVESR